MSENIDNKNLKKTSHSSTISSNLPQNCKTSSAVTMHVRKVFKLSTAWTTLSPRYGSQLEICVTALKTKQCNTQKQFRR